jgi:hypothetical protein
MIKYSVMSGKLKGIPALNTSPLNNKFCKAMSKKKDSICGSCYSINMLKTFRKMCDAPFQRYGKFLSKKVHPLEYLPKPPNALYVRFSAHGELINLNHTINLFKICELAPKTTFTLWTKRKSLAWKAVKEIGKPKNLILIYSEPDVDGSSKLPKYFDKVFVVQKEKDSKTNCFGACMDCLKCYDQTDETSYIYEEIK